MWYNEPQDCLIILSKLSEGLLSLQQKTSLRTVGSRLGQAEVVGNKDFKLAPMTGDTMHDPT